jgi:hypothetical protein
MRGRHQRYSRAYGVAPMRTLLLFLFIIAGSAHASTFTKWTHSSNNNIFYVSDHKACASRCIYPSSEYLCTITLGTGYNNKTCQITDLNYATNPTRNEGNVYGTNITCPLGHTGITCNTVMPTCPGGVTFNTTTNSCPSVPLIDQPCAQTWSGGEMVWSNSKQQCVKYPNLTESEYCKFMGGKSNSAIRSVNSNSPNGPSQYTDSSKCVSNTNQQTADCTSRVNTDGTGAYTCKVTGTFSGTHAPTGSNMPDGFCASGTCVDVPPIPPEPAAPAPTNTSSSDPCVYASNGSGGQSCTSTNNSSSEGTANCGTVNGVWGCQKSPPSNNGISITTNVSTASNAQGGTTTTKTDTATSTKCTDIGSCTSGSTTSVTTTSTNATGATTSVTGTCTGAQCPSETGNPDGDGDGFGDCIGDSCGTDDFTSPGGFGGPDTADAMPVLEEVPTYAETFATFKQRVSDAPLVAGLSNISVPSGGSCDIGSASLFGGSISFNHFCTIAPSILSGLTYLFLAIWAWAAIRLFFTA